MTVRQDTLSRTAFVIVFGVSLAVAAGNSGLQSVLPAIGRQIGIPDPLIAAIFSLSALLWTVSAPYWARKSDTTGRRPMIALGLAGFCVSMTGCAGVVWLGLNKMLAPLLVFAGFALLRAVFGMIGSAANPASQAYVAERTQGERRTEALSQLAGAFGLGTIAGPAVAPLFVLPVVGLAGPMFAFAFLAALVLLAVWRGVPETRPVAPVETGGSPLQAAPERKSPGLWRDPSIRPFLLYGLIAGSAQQVNGYTLGFLVIDKLGETPLQAQRLIGVAMMAGALAGLLAQWGLIRMFRMGPRHLLRWGAGLAALGNLALAAAPSYEMLVFAYALINLGYGFCRPGFTAGASLAAPDGKQGEVAGAVTAVNGACVIVTPVLGVALYRLDHPAPFIANAVGLALLLGYVFWSLSLRRAGETPTNDAQAAASSIDYAEGGG
jgi:MFS family permease